MSDSILPVPPAIRIRQAELKIAQIRFELAQRQANDIAGFKGAVDRKSIYDAKYNFAVAEQEVEIAQARLDLEVKAASLPEQMSLAWPRTECKPEDIQPEMATHGTLRPCGCWVQYGYDCPLHAGGKPVDVLAVANEILDGIRSGNAGAPASIAKIIKARLHL
jgi:hypothetical protein